MAAKATIGNGLGSVTTILDSDAVVADQHTVVGIDGALAGVMHFAVQGGPDASGYAAEVLGQALSAVCTFNN
jgi:hypothetical protein